MLVAAGMVPCLVKIVSHSMCYLFLERGLDFSKLGLVSLL